MTPIKLKVKSTGMRVVELALSTMNRIRKRRLAPNDLRSDDFFLVEFPKSGITWLSTILANAALIEGGRPEEVTFANVQFYIPDIHMSRHVGSRKFDRPPVRIVKSHSTFNPYYKIVIYLVRHPFSVMKSYHNFLKSHSKGYDLEFSELCKHEKLGIPAWRNHVKSWVHAEDNSLRLHLIRYEDLVSDGFAEIKNISTNFGWNISEAAITASISKSNMPSMKSSEAKFRSHAPHYNFSFVGGTEISSEEHVEMKRWICETCKTELISLGYQEQEF